jgi:hypothetical protein
MAQSIIKRLSNEGESPRSAFELTGDVVRLANNCLNEVLHGFPCPELPTLLGKSVEQAEQLLNEIYRCDESAGTLMITESDLALLARCIRRTVSELGPEFSTRTGFEVGEANAHEEEITKALGEEPW